MPLDSSTIGFLPVNETIILKVKINVHLIVRNYLNQERIIKNVELTDQIMFKISPSPIEVVLSGINTVYGKNSHIIIDGSETYDSDIEGLHYYLPFLFKWVCPSNIPKYECKNKATSGTNPYLISFYSSSLLNYGLHYNQYYDFSAIAERKNKKSQKDFQVKIIDLKDVPLIGKF